MKKRISVLLTVVMLIAVVLPAGAAAANKPQIQVPTVYCRGYGDNIIDENGTQVYDIVLPEGYIADAVANCMGDFIDAIFLNEVEEYREKFNSYLLPLYERVKLDPNGDPLYGTHTNFNAANYLWRGAQSSYALRDFDFYPDWRLDPIYNASLLNDYINAIKTKTGCDKVNLIGRCAGSDTVMAYVAEYGCDSINKIVFHTPAVFGALAVSELFSGEINFTADNIKLFIDQSIEFGDDILGEFITTTIETMSKTYGLETTCSLLNKAYAKVLKPILRDVLINSYASFPNFWAMVDAEHTEKAMAYIFDGVEEEYAGMIEKINNYNTKVKYRMNDLLDEIDAAGIPVSVLSKYGIASWPVFESSNLLSDGTALIKNESLGAVSAGAKTPLSDSYIAAAVAAGNGEYISPDKMIDASSCRYKETTWFVSNCYHANFPAYMENFVLTILRSETPVTVDTYEGYPRFLVQTGDAYTGGSVVPQTEENAIVIGGEEDPAAEKKSFFDLIKAFFDVLKRFIKALIAGEVNTDSIVFKIN